MKNLLKAADVRNLMGTGERVLYVDQGAIITPEARDLAAKLGVIIKRAEADPCGTPTGRSVPGNAPDACCSSPAAP